MTAVGVLMLVGLVLAGCAGGPSQDEQVERFAIEVAAVVDGDKDDPEVRELAADLAEDSAERCHDEDFWRIATSPLAETPWDLNMQYIWAASCGVLYDDIPDSLDEKYRAVIAEYVMSEQ